MRASTPESRERKRIYQAEWVRRNPERAKEILRQSYVKHREKRLAYARERFQPGLRQKNGYKHWKSYVQRIYGITLKQFQERLAKQKDLCGICKDPLILRQSVHGKITMRGSAIDHNHKTGKFRGILCHRCNAALGWMEDKDNWMDKANNYLREFL